MNKQTTRISTYTVSCHQCGRFRPAGDYFGRPTGRGACLMSCATNLLALKGRRCANFQPSASARV